MLKSFLILDHTGDIYIEKHYISGLKRSDFEFFRGIFQEKNNSPPIFESFGNHFIVHKHHDIFAIGVVSSDKFSLFNSEIVVTMVKYIEQYLGGPLNMSRLKADFFVVYEVIDQCISFGFPNIDDSNVLKRFVPLPKIPAHAITKYPWRTVPTSCVNPYMTLNICETLDLYVDSNGHHQLFQIRGDVNLDSNLPGSPSVMVKIQNPISNSDFSYHRCIDCSMLDKTELSFIPPSGSFTLLSYVTQDQKIQPPLLISPRFKWSEYGVRFDISVSYSHPISATKVMVSFQLPTSLQKPTLAVSSGHVQFDISSYSVIWDLSDLVDSPVLHGFSSMSTEQLTDPNSQILISANFHVDGILLTDFSINEFKLADDKIPRQIITSTKSGKYSFEPLY